MCVVSNSGRHFEAMRGGESEETGDWGEDFEMTMNREGMRREFEPNLKGRMIITILSSMTRMSRGRCPLGRGLMIQFLRYRSAMEVDGDDESSVFAKRKDGAPK